MTVAPQVKPPPKLARSTVSPAFRRPSASATERAMGRVAVELGNSAKDVVISKNSQQAADISREDDAMDQLHQQLFNVLMDTEWKHGVAAAVDITLLGRFYERFADHAVEIGRRVVFEATGKTTDQ